MSDFYLSDVVEESPHVLRETVQKNSEMKTTEYNSSQEEGELSPKNELLNNGHDTEAKIVNRYSYSDSSRFLLLAYSTYISAFLCQILILLNWSMHTFKCTYKAPTHI